MKKRIIKYSLIIILLLFCILNYITKNIPYERNYFKKIGMSKNGVGYKYEDMIKDYGNPKGEENLENGWKKAVYDNLVISFEPEISGLYFLANIVITKGEYKFGRKKIGIGSTKEDVLKAYKNIDISYDSPYTYIDGNIYIQFYIDNNDKVYKIQFFTYYS